MNEENTQQIPPYIERLFAAIADSRAEMRTELSSVRAEITTSNERLIKLEEKVDERLRETRPIWEAVLARLDSIESRMNTLELSNSAIEMRLGALEIRMGAFESKLSKIDEKFNVLALDMVEMRADTNILKRRLPPAA